MQFGWVVLLSILPKELIAINLYQVGLFSICNNDDSVNRTSQRYQDAQRYSEVLARLVEDDLTLAKEKRYESLYNRGATFSYTEFLDSKIYGSIEYTPIDVCNDFDHLTLRASSYFLIGEASWGGLEAPP